MNDSAAGRDEYTFMLKKLVNKILSRGSSANSFSSGAPGGSFIQVFGDKPLKELFALKKEIPLHDHSLDWLERPAETFVNYVDAHQALPFEGIPYDEKYYLKPPNYMVSQTHRLWLTLNAIKPYLENRPDYNLLDIGAHPYSLDVVLREYAQYPGKIKATANLPVEEGWREILANLKIEVEYVNLDKYVMPDPSMPDIPAVFEEADESVDMALMAHVIEHLYHPFEIVKEITRVLKKGGVAVFTTDNAYRWEGFAGFMELHPFVYDPMPETAAMTFSFWRGHNRFFTEWDFRMMLEKAGLNVEKVIFQEVIFNGFNKGVFKYPTESMPQWKNEILSRIPAHRNEIIVIARKA